VIDEPLSGITLWLSDSESVLACSHVFVVVKDSLGSSHSGHDLELMVSSDARTSCLEGVMASRDDVPFLVGSSMARPHLDSVVFHVLASFTVNTESLVLIISQVSSAELESLSVVRSLLPLSHNESSTVSASLEFRREDVA